MSRLVGRQGSGQYKWQSDLLYEYHKLPPRVRWFGLASLVAAVVAMVGLAVLAMFLSGGSASAVHGSVDDLSVERIEITQAIQCLEQSDGYKNCPDNTLELSNSRLTAVRVYIGQRGGLCTNGEYESVADGATVKLRYIVTHDPNLPHVPTMKEKLFNVPCGARRDFPVLRDDERGSANFIFSAEELGLKPDWVNTFWVEAEVVAPSTIQDVTPDNDKREVTVKLFPRPTFEVEGVGILYNPGGQKLLVDPKAVLNAGRQMEASWPMHVEYHPWLGKWLLYGTNPSTGEKCKVCPPLEQTTLAEDNALLQYLSKFWETMKPQPDALIGLLPHGIKGPERGLSAAWPMTPVAWCILQDPAFDQRCAAHETGHNLLLEHPIKDACAPTASILETGFDVAQNKALPGTDFADFMKGGGGNWISPYHWNLMLDKPLSKEWSNCESSSSTTSLSAGETSLVSASASQQPAVLVSGRVRDDGSGELHPLYHVTSEGPFPVSDPGGDYCLDFQTPGGATLASHCFDLSFTALETGEPTNTDGFVFELPLPADTGRLVLRHGSTVLAEQVKSEHPPQMAVVEPQAGEVISGTATASWAATDEDGDALQYIVLYSPDGGESLAPLVIDIDWNSLPIDGTLLPGGDSAQIRVMASDGFNTTVAESASFEVPRKAPDTFIVTPRSNDLLAPGEDTVFTGHAQDPEDGKLSGSSLTWASDRDGFLGNGSELVLPADTLSIGAHQITLTATDSDGQTAADTLTVFVDSTGVWASCQPSLGEMGLTRGDHFNIDLSYCGAGTSENPGPDVTFAARMHPNKFFGPAHSVASLTVPGGLCSKQSIVYPTDELPTGTDRVVVDVKTDATGDAILASCDFMLTINEPPVADLKIVGQQVQNAPAQIPVSQDVQIVLNKVIHNSGPYEPVGATTETTITVPAGCTVSPNPHIQEFYNLPVSVDILHHEPFTIHCDQLGQHTFVFDDAVDVATSGITDPDPSNDSARTELTVAAVTQADAKITSASFVDPPTKIPLNQAVDITLREHIHNNGPWGPVDIAINTNAAPPTGCTIVPKNVPASIPGVPVSVDQVTDEIWTVKCTQAGLKTFVFNNSIDVSTPYVFDLNLANNAARKLLTVKDPPYPYRGDDICDGQDNNGDTVVDEGWDLVGSPVADCLDPALDTDADAITNDIDADDDGDGWSDANEGFMRTDPLNACPLDVYHDAWPPDVDNSGSVNIMDVVLFKSVMGGTYDQRYDLNASSTINIMDVLPYKPVLGASCAGP